MLRHVLDLAYIEGPPARSRRLLRAPPVARAGLQTVGPFIFFDHMGPADFGPGQGVNVRPHPHIGLATVTYLFEGAFMHRDSLGTAQLIRPGDVNWMVAGRGIVHSERTPDSVRDAAGARVRTASRPGWRCRARTRRSRPRSSIIRPRACRGSSPGGARCA